MLFCLEQVHPHGDREQEDAEHDRAEHDETDPPAGGAAHRAGRDAFRDDGRLRLLQLCGTGLHARRRVLQVKLRAAVRAAD